MNTILFYSQILVSVILIALIVLQQRGTALGAGFGGSSEVYSAKRGIQKKLHYFTIAFAAAFLILGILNIAIS